MLNNKYRATKGCRCEDCIRVRKYYAEKQREFRQRHPQQTKKNNLKQFGLTYEQWQQMVQEQNNRCYVCSQEEFGENQSGRMSLAIDHDHNTGKVRRLLCHRCNRALGLLGDDFTRVQALANYRKQFE